MEGQENNVQENSVQYEIKTIDNGMKELYIEGRKVFTLSETFTTEQVEEVYRLVVSAYQNGIADIRKMFLQALGPVQAG